MSDLAARLDTAVRSFAPVGVFEPPGSTRHVDLLRAAGFPAVRLEPQSGGGRAAPATDPLPHLLIVALPRARFSTGEPDRRQIIAAATAIAERAAGGSLVLVLDPPYPGSTRRELLPLMPPSDFVVACAAGVRDSAGRLRRWVAAGFGPSAAAPAAELLERLGAPVFVASSPEAAEAAGLVGPSVRGVLAAVTNEWETAFDRAGLPLGEILGAAGLWDEFPDLRPGAHSPPEPAALNWSLRRYNASCGVAERAEEVRAATPARIIARVVDALNSVSKPVRGSRILVVGLTVGTGTMPSESALEIIRALQKKLAIVQYYDPHVPVLDRIEYGLGDATASLSSGGEAVGTYDVVLILHNRPGCDWGVVTSRCGLVVEAQNVTFGTK